MLRIRQSLTLRIAASVVVLFLTFGGLLYFFVLRAISEFAQNEIERDLQALSRRVYNICNTSFDDILQSGMADDEATFIIEQALALGQIEDFFRQQNLGGLVYQAQAMEMLLEENLPMSAARLLEEAAPQGRTISLGLDAENYFAYHFDFSPWHWQLIIVKSKKDYIELTARVKRVHVYLLSLLIVAAFLSVLFLYHSIKRPIDTIVQPLKSGRRPKYRGIDVFEFLSDTIATMMGSLQKSEEKYRSLIETTSDFVWEIDNIGRYRYANPAIQDILGYTPAEVAGKKPIDLMAPGQEAHFNAMLRDLATFKMPFERLENVYRHKNGSDIVLDTRAVPIRDADGQLSGYRGIDRDITDRKLYETELQRTRALLETAINQSPSGILIADAPDVSIRLANAAAFNIRGGPKDLLTDIDVTEHSARWQTFYPDGCPYDPQDLPLSKAIISGEVTKDAEVIIRDESGVERWVSANAAPIRDPDGQIQAGIVVFHDITDRVQAESALRESEERFRTLVEQSPLGISLIGNDGRYKYINPKFQELFGYSLAEISSGNEWFQKAFPDETYRRRVSATWIEDQKQTKSGQAKTRVFKVICKDGSSKEVLFRPVKMGNLDQFVIYEDITERKSVEERLRQAQKMESIGRLAGGVAHDLNNLLSPILGYSEMLAKDFDTDDARRDSVNEIQRAGYRARDLVRQLLAFSRKQTLEYIPLNLNSAIEGFEKLLRRTIREDIEIEIIQADNLPTVTADIGQIEQVIMNLAVNAQDAMPDGGKLTLTTEVVTLDGSQVADRPGAQPGRYVMLTVSDTGGGMDAATRKHIFEPFFSTKGEQGTGLGLATVYGIVTQHGGSIVVQSRPGEGSTFKIYLPAAAEAPVVDKPHEGVRIGLSGTETILLVEDNEQVRNLGHAILTRQGYRLLTAENGVEALSVLASYDGPVDLLLSDVIMPEMNGKELYTNVTAKYPGTKVLFMSGYIDNVIADRGVLEKGVQFIQKPFTVQGLAAKVREVLEQK